MAILINDNYSLSATKPFDARYMNISTPWVDCAEVIAAIPTYRYVGLTVNIAGTEYWWKDGIADGNLVPKVLGGVSNLSGATNGLSLYSGDTYIGLGGVLTQNTTICGGDEILCLGTSASTLSSLFIESSGAVQIQSGSIYTNAASSANYMGGNFCIQLDDTNATFYDNSIGKYGLKYSACISTGFTNSCSIVDKGFVDEKSNTIGINNVTINYLATQIDDFIGVSGATQICLPTTPKFGQRVIIADVCGNALADNIVIIGNGMCINGSSSAIINTDYGAMTFINNGYSWSVVAFIN